MAAKILLSTGGEIHVDCPAHVARDKVATAILLASRCPEERGAMVEFVSRPDNLSVWLNPAHIVGVKAVP